jgi:SAM-dependent methyltransferase
MTATGVVKLIRRVVAGRVLHLEHSPPQMDYMDSFQSVGGNLWPASDLLIKYLTDSRAAERKHVLELGSGCGYAGIACGVLGATGVTLSDRVITERRMEHDAEGMLVEYTAQPNRMLLDLSEDNITRNRGELGDRKLDVRELEWGEENIDHITQLGSGHYDLIVGSDVTYHANLSESLFWTVSQLLKRAKARSNNTAEASGKYGAIAFLAAHQFRLDSATAHTLQTAKRFGLHCATLATSSEAGGVGECGAQQLESNNARSLHGAIPDAGSAFVRRYTNEPGVTGDFALWRFTLAPGPCN